MARRVTCQNCQEEIIVVFLHPGDMAHCKACGEHSLVEESAPEIDTPPDHLINSAWIAGVHDGGFEDQSRHFYPFRIGDVLSQSFEVYLGSFLPLMGLATLMYIPQIMMTTSSMMTVGPDSQMTEGVIGAMLLATIISVLLSSIMAGAVTHGVFQKLMKEKFSVRDCLFSAMRRIVYLSIVSLIVGLLAGLASIFFIVPGIFVYCILWVAVPVTMVERCGVSESLRRSSELTRGNRLAIFGITAAYAIVAGVVLLIVMASTGGFTFSATGSESLFESILDFLVTITFNALYAVIVAVGYYRLRVAREGTGINELVAVFD